MTRSFVMFSICIAAMACTRHEQERDDEAPASTAEGSAAARAYDAVRRDGALLLDVRTRQEFESGRIDGSHNIPAQELRSRASEVTDLAGGRDKPVVVYCTTRPCSAFARTELLRLDFRNVIDAGRVTDWPVQKEILRGGAR